MIAAVSETDSWVGSDHANIRFTYLATGPVEHDTRIVSFTATPKDPGLDMKVHPRSGLQIQIDETGIVNFAMGAVELLQLHHHHVRHTVIGAWFEYGYMPRTWAELQASP